MKPIQERLEECVAMRMWMRATQIDEAPECRRLKELMNEFVQDGIPASGSFAVAKIGRRVYYMLSTKTDSKIGLNPQKK